MLPADWLRRFERERRLAPLTTWGIGGPAEMFCAPATVDELGAVVPQLWRSGVPYRVIGGGSNLLVADQGVRGAVLSLDRLRAVVCDADLVIAEAGARLHQVITHAANEGHAGLETLVGIPGRIGGAIFGNAGSKYGAIGERVRWVELMEPDGTVVRVVPEPGFFAYRRSHVGDRIVVRAALATEPGDKRGLRARIREVIAERRRSQPGWVGNAGCVFKNPDGHSAGHLIDSAACKEMRAGGIVVSPTHANFFENDDRGNEADVRRLVERVCDRVRRVHGVELEMEVRQWC